MFAVQPVLARLHKFVRQKLESVSPAEQAEDGCRKFGVRDASAGDCGTVVVGEAVTMSGSWQVSNQAHVCESAPIDRLGTQTYPSQGAKAAK